MRNSEKSNPNNGAVRRVPERHCLGCNAPKPKTELIRIVRTPQGDVVLDTTGKHSGRGAYICRSASCLAKARKSGRIARNLSCAIPDEVYADMEKELIGE